MIRTCDYSQCEVEFEPTRPHHRFHSESCRYWHHVEESENAVHNALEPSSEHPLREVRGSQEEGGVSADYLLLAREQICRTLLATNFFTADDLASLGIPDEYRRSVHGSATGYFSGERPYMEEAGRRKSERPERKGGKNTIFRITGRGRRELPGLLKGMAGPVEDARRRLFGDATVGVDASRGPADLPPADSTTVAGIHPGEPQSRPTGALDGTGSSSPNPPVQGASDDEGAGSGLTSHEPEPVAQPLFDAAPPDMYDPWEDAA